MCVQMPVRSPESLSLQQDFPCAYKDEQVRMSQVDTCSSGREGAFHSDAHILTMKTCSGPAMADSID